MNKRRPSRLPQLYFLTSPRAASWSTAVTVEMRTTTGALLVASLATTSSWVSPLAVPAHVARMRYLASASSDFSPRPAQGEGSWRTVRPLASTASTRPALGKARPRTRRFKREILLAKGISGAVLIRLAAISPIAAVASMLGLFAMILAPVVAVEAMLLAGLLVICGAANYWPVNIVTAALGAAGAAGCLYGNVVWWETRRAAAARRRAAKQGRHIRQGERIVETPEDDSAGLVALVVGAISAAIIGALP